jgi:hypothetical protein
MSSVTQIRIFRNRFFAARRGEFSPPAGETGRRIVFQKPGKLTPTHEERDVCIMFKHEKLLFRPVGVEGPNPQCAALLSDIASEQRAKVVYEYLYRQIED